ncbi:hypothetical protein H0H92_008387 [Tricholoma furcatifolium]|nr:hypothetical protein H0H92_008387 [Tricholoma furcatifolium]
MPSDEKAAEEAQECAVRKWRQLTLPRYNGKRGSLPFDLEVKRRSEERIVNEWHWLADKENVDVNPTVFDVELKVLTMPARVISYCRR